MEVPAGQIVNFRGSLPRSENNVLQPMLHPATHILLPPPGECSGRSDKDIHLSDSSDISAAV